MKERILVLRSEVVESFLSGKTGMIFVSEEEALDILNSGFFVDRSIAEVNENWRQVIPYVVMMDSEKVLLMKRTSRQTEKRLHNLYSIGVGGHIEEKDGQSPREAFLNGMKREILEEVDAEVLSKDFIGIINDLSTSVSRVHLGYVYLAKVRFKDMKEKEMFEWQLVSFEDLDKFKEGMENWSKIALDGLKYHLLQK